MRSPEMRDERRIWWGVVLIALGVLFLLDRFGVFTIHAWWQFWPTLLILTGIGHLFWPDVRARIARGVQFVLLGLWFFACEWHWYGLSYQTGWPVILVIIGVSLLLRTMLERRRDESAGEGDHHV